MVVATVNSDDNPVTSRAYGVMSLPTLLVFRGGEVVGSFIGGIVVGIFVPGTVYGFIGSLVVAILGAVILLGVLRLLSPRRA